MNIHYAVLSLLVASCTGVSVARHHPTIQVKHSNTSSCSDPGGCKQIVPGKLATPSATPALQAIPFAMPLLMMWDGFPTVGYQALIEEKFGPLDTASGVRYRVMAAVVLIAIFGYTMSALAIIYETDFHALTDHDTSDRAILLDLDRETAKSVHISAHGTGISPVSSGRHSPCDIEQDKSGEGAYVDMELSTLIQDCGVSALCILSPWEQDDSSELTLEWPLWIAAYVIHLQGLVLQGGLLLYMMLQLQPQFTLPESRQRGEDHPLGIVFIAIYIHFLNCALDIPYSYELIKHFGDFHDSAQKRMIMAPILITDSVVVPSLVVFIGSLYIAMARSPVDVILNSVAVVFVKDIDNWILSLVTRASWFSGCMKDRTVRFPVDKNSMRQMLMLVCYIPVVPVTTTLVMLWLALGVLKM